MSHPAESDQLKSCCAAVYQSDFVRMLLGDSFHPGGLRLTERLGELLELGPGRRVLDVASGKGESAIFLAKHFGCEVVGVDFGAENISEASERARVAGVERLATFRQGDAEQLDLPDASFDAVICECAFCTFPNKPSAAGQFFRVLKPGGRVGLSDLTRSGALPPELDSLLAWIACIADARPVEEYANYLAGAGLGCVRVEPHDEALSEMVRSIQGKLLGAELMFKLNAVSPDGVDLADAKSIARAAADAVRAKTLGYALITGERS
ncbi:MAG: class I SAM-dependent methyltransferase [Terriglobia bacterium]